MRPRDLFEPSAVAVFCDSSQEGDRGQAVLENLIQGGFEGPLAVVDAAAPALQGHTCLRDPREFGTRIDLAVIASPVEELRRSVDRAVMTGAKLVAVVRNLRGAEPGLAQELATQCHNRGARLLGPDSLGFADLNRGLNATWSPSMPGRGAVALISQSSALAIALLDLAADRRVGVSQVVGLGDKTDLDEDDVLAALRDDPATEVVVLYIESIRAGKEFLKRAEGLAVLKPIVVFKGGTTRSGEQAAAIHHGRPIVSEIAYGAVFQRTGLARARSLEAVFDNVQAFLGQPIPSGKRVVVVANGGGAAIIAADAIEHHGLSLAEISGEALAFHEHNPVELPHEAPPEQLAAAVLAALSEPGADAGLVLVAPNGRHAPELYAQRLSALGPQAKPLFAVFLGGKRVRPARANLAEARIPHFPTPERAVAALAASCNYGIWRKRPPRIVTRFPVNRRRVERILERCRRLFERTVGEHLAREVLEAYGFTIPEGRLAQDAPEAVEAALQLGFPLTLRLVSPDPFDREALGAVRSNLTSVARVRDAVDLVRLRVREQEPPPRIEGLLLEREFRPGLATVVGMTRDPEFGAMLMFGLRGASVEVLEDVAFHLAPITADEARAMLEGSRFWPVLEAENRALAADTGAIAIALMRISQLVTDFPEIQNVEINPFVVAPPGVASIAALARIGLSPGGAA